MSHWRRAAAALTITAALAVTSRAQQQDRSVNAAAIRTAIERTLAVAPRRFEHLTAPAQAGVRVLDVRVDRRSPSAQRITIDLSQKTIASRVPDRQATLGGRRGPSISSRHLARLPTSGTSA